MCVSLLETFLMSGMCHWLTGHINLPETQPFVEKLFNILQHATPPDHFQAYLQTLLRELDEPQEVRFFLLI